MDIANPMNEHIAFYITKKKLTNLSKIIYYLPSVHRPNMKGREGRVVKLVNTTDLKSVAPNTSLRVQVPSRPPHFTHYGVNLSQGRAVR